MARCKWQESNGWKQESGWGNTSQNHLAGSRTQPRTERRPLVATSLQFFRKGDWHWKTLTICQFHWHDFRCSLQSKLSKQRSVVLAKLSNSKTRPGSIVVTTNPKTHSVVFAESYTTPGATSAVLAFSPHRRDAYHRWHVWPKSRWSTAPAIYSCHDFPLEKTPRIKSCQFLKSLWLEHGGCN